LLLSIGKLAEIEVELGQGEMHLAVVRILAHRVAQLDLGRARIPRRQRLLRLLEIIARLASPGSKASPSAQAAVSPSRPRFIRLPSFPILP